MYVRPGSRIRPSHQTNRVISIQIEEVKGVTQILDEEEEIALKEFAKFEEKLKQQRGPDSMPSINNGKGGLKTAEA